MLMVDITKEGIFLIRNYVLNIYQVYTGSVVWPCDCYQVYTGNMCGGIVNGLVCGVIVRTSVCTCLRSCRIR